MPFVIIFLFVTTGGWGLLQPQWVYKDYVFRCSSQLQGDVSHRGLPTVRPRNVSAVPLRQHGQEDSLRRTDEQSRRCAVRQKMHQGEQAQESPRAAASNRDVTKDFVCSETQLRQAQVQPAVLHWDRSPVPVAVQPSLELWPTSLRAAMPLRSLPTLLED